jgi:hypothetical protein
MLPLALLRPRRDQALDVGVLDPCRQWATCKSSQGHYELFAPWDRNAWVVPAPDVGMLNTVPGWSARADELSESIRFLDGFLRSKSALAERYPGGKGRTVLPARVAFCAKSVRPPSSLTRTVHRP